MEHSVTHPIEPDVTVVYHRSPRTRHRDSIANYIRAMVLHSGDRRICCWGPDDASQQLDAPLPSNVTYRPIFGEARWRLGIVPPTAQLIQDVLDARRSTSGQGVFWFHVWDYAWPFILSNRDSLILTVHGSGSHTALRFGRYSARYAYHRIAEMAAVRRAHLVIPVSPESRAHTLGLLSDDSQDKVKYLPTFVDTRIFSPDDDLRSARPAGAPWPVVLFTGRIAAEKRLDRALKAFERFRLAYPQAEFRVVGSGPLLSTLREAGVRGVTFTGDLPHAEVVREYQAADLLLLLSEREGIPLTLLESLACGTPAVASGVGGIPSVLSSGVNGFIVNPDDASEVADRMAAVVKLGGSLRASSVESVRAFRQDIVVPRIWATIDERCKTRRDRREPPSEVTARP